MACYLSVPLGSLLPTGPPEARSAWPSGAPDPGRKVARRPPTIQPPLLGHLNIQAGYIKFCPKLFKLLKIAIHRNIFYFRYVTQTLENRSENIFSVQTIHKTKSLFVTLATPDGSCLWDFDVNKFSCNAQVRTAKPTAPQMYLFWMNGFGRIFIQAVVHFLFSAVQFRDNHPLSNQKLQESLFGCIFLNSNE